MRSVRSSRHQLFTIALLCVMSSIVLAQTKSSAAKKNKDSSCTQDNSGLSLRAGFCATVLADGIGHARHLVAGSSGALYVNTWSGEYYDMDKVAALLDKYPKPTDTQIKEALAGNLCRCGTHLRIVRAVKRASGQLT